MSTNLRLNFKFKIPTNLRLNWPEGRTPVWSFPPSLCRCEAAEIKSNLAAKNKLYEAAEIRFELYFFCSSPCAAAGNKLNVEVEVD